MKIISSAVLNQNDALITATYTPDGAVIVAGGGTINEPGKVIVWDASSLATLRTIELECPANNIARAVAALAVSPDASTLALARLTSDTIELCDFSTYRSRSRLKMFTQPTSWNPTGTLNTATHVSSMCFSHNGHLLAAGCWDCTAKTWNVEGEPSAGRLFKHEDNVDFVALKSDNRAPGT